MRPIVIAAAIMCAGAMPAAAQSQGERPVKSTIEYKECQASAASMADERSCLAAEVDRMRRQLAVVAQETGISDESQTLWMASMNYDCEAEGSGGGTSAGMRIMACEIEGIADRVDYLRRNGRW